jgi:phage terminase large subunit-like protein
MVPLRQWAAGGWLRTTQGNVVDYAQVRNDILRDAASLGYQIGSIGYDPWNASETVQLLEESGVQMVPVRQSYSQLSAPTKALERLVLGSVPAAPLIRTGGNPLLRWMADCVEIRSDDSGNVRPVKPDRGKSSKRIDGIVALIMAEREDMADGDVMSAGDAFMASLVVVCSSCATVNQRSSTRCTKCSAPVGAAAV